MDLNLHVSEGHSEGQGQMESNFSAACQSFVKYVEMQTSSSEFYHWLVPTFLYYHRIVSVILQPLHLGMAWKGQTAFIME